MTQAVPGKVLIGKMNLKLEKFNDAITLNKNGGYKKINAIRVFYTDKYVRGFEIYYKLNDGDLLKAGHNSPKKKGDLQVTIFEIGPDDYLSEILGAYGKDKDINKITNITFLTYRGKAATFGGSGPKCFSHTFPGFTFGAFAGGYKKKIEWLEIDVLPLPEDFKKDFQKINVNVIMGNMNNGAPFVQQVIAQPYQAGFAQVQMPQISFQPTQHKQIQQPQRFSLENSDSFQQRESNPIFSSKYPSFNNVPVEQPSYQPQYFYQSPNQMGGQAPYPGAQTYNYPQYQQPKYPY